MSEFELTIADELFYKIHGPKYCPHCKATQPMKRFVLEGSEKTKLGGYTLTHNFVGAYVCSICFKNIDKALTVTHRGSDND